jgi:cell division protein FtsB
MDSQVVALLGGAIITALGAIATQRSAARAAVRNAQTASRTDMEQEAFERAKGYYTDTIDRQARDIMSLETAMSGLEARVAQLKARVTDLESQLDAAKRALRRAIEEAGG